MARIRTIKPAFWTDEKLAELPRDTRLLFLGLISAMADDAGRCKGNPRVVRAAVFPMDDDVSAADVERMLGALDAAGRVRLYSAGGERYVQIVNWAKHQRIDKPQGAQFPGPDGEPAGEVPAKVRERSGNDSKNAPGTGRERSLTDKEEEGEEEKEREKSKEPKGGDTAPPVERRAAKTAVRRGVPAPWMGDVRRVWRARFSGEPPKLAAAVLRPVVADVGESEMVARLERYVADLPGRYANLHNFAATHGDYAADAATPSSAADDLARRVAALKREQDAQDVQDAAWLAARRDNGATPPVGGGVAA